MARRVFLPESIAEWIGQRLPIGDLSRIHFRLGPRIPFWWVARSRRFSGLTLWNRVYLVDRCWCTEPLTQASLELVLHELVHVVQYRRHPITFPLRYLAAHIRYGYEDNPAEVEAREVAAGIASSYFEPAD